jgi:amidase
MEGTETIDAYGIAQTRAFRDALRCAFSEDWARQDVDVILSPVYIGPAAPHDTALYSSYTAIWNLVDCPGIAFPTSTRVSAEDMERGYAVGDDEAWNEYDAHVRALWDGHDYEGAPIGLQLTARKHHDSMLIAALELMRDALQLEQ